MPIGRGEIQGPITPSRENTREVVAHTHEIAAREVAAGIATAMSCAADAANVVAASVVMMGSATAVGCAEGGVAVRGTGLALVTVAMTGAMTAPGGVGKGAVGVVKFQVGAGTGSVTGRIVPLGLRALIGVDAL